MAGGALLSQACTLSEFVERFFWAVSYRGIAWSRCRGGGLARYTTYTLLYTVQYHAEERRHRWFKRVIVPYFRLKAPCRSITFMTCVRGVGFVAR